MSSINPRISRALSTLASIGIVLACADDVESLGHGYMPVTAVYCGMHVDLRMYLWHDDIWVTLNIGAGMPYSRIVLDVEGNNILLSKTVVTISPHD